MDLSRILLRRRNAETRLTLEGWVYLVFVAFISIGSILRNVNLLVLMAGLMYAPLVLHWRTCNQLLRTLRAKRLMPNRIHAGQSVSVPWTVNNQSAQTTAWNVTLADQMIRHDQQPTGVARMPNRSREWRQWASTPLRPAAVIKLGKRLIDVLRGHGWHSERAQLMTIDHVKGRRSATGVWRVCFPSRGRYQIGPAVMTAISPLGLVESRIKLDQSEDCYVAPKLGKLNPGWLQRFQSVRAGADQGSRRRGLDQEQFHALRPWRSGDSMKHIHWRTTARQGQPIVRQFDQNDDRDVALVLDLWRPSNSENGSKKQEVFDARVETALSFAATVVSRANRDVCGRITIGVCGDRSDFFPGRQAKFVTLVMRSLAVASASGQPATADVLLDVAELVAAGTPIFVISTRDQPGQLLPRQTDHSPADPISVAADAVRRKRLAQVQSAVNWLRVDDDQFARLFSRS